MNKNEKPPAVILLPDDAKAQSAVMERAQAAAAKPAVAKTADVSAANPRTGWFTRMNPFRAAPSAAPAPAPRATQPELSLSDVKVVHNDLADADVDVVSVGSRANAPGSAPKLPSGRGRALDVLDDIIKSK